MNYVSTEQTARRFLDEFLAGLKGKPELLRELEGLFKNCSFWAPVNHPNVTGWGRFGSIIADDASNIIVNAVFKGGVIVEIPLSDIIDCKVCTVPF